MGCGFCAMRRRDDADAAVALLAEHHPGTAVIGRVTDRAGIVEVPDLRIEGGRGRPGDGLTGALWPTCTTDGTGGGQLQPCSRTEVAQNRAATR